MEIKTLGEYGTSLSKLHYSPHLYRMAGFNSRPNAISLLICPLPTPLRIAHVCTYVAEMRQLRNVLLAYPSFSL